MPSLTRRFDEAFAYAHEVHGTQTRKGTGAPYIGHLMGVASIVIDDGGTRTKRSPRCCTTPPEDRGGRERLEDIRTRFGDAVATIVEDCTDSWTTPQGAVARAQEEVRGTRAHAGAVEPARVGGRQGAQRLRDPARPAQRRGAGRGSGSMPARTTSWRITSRWCDRTGKRAADGSWTSSIASSAGSSGRWGIEEFRVLGF